MLHMDKVNFYSVCVAEGWMLKTAFLFYFVSRLAYYLYK